MRSELARGAGQDALRDLPKVDRVALGATADAPRYDGTSGKAVTRCTTVPPPLATSIARRTATSALGDPSVPTTIDCIDPPYARSRETSVRSADFNQRTMVTPFVQRASPNARPRGLVVLEDLRQLRSEDVLGGLVGQLERAPRPRGFVLSGRDVSCACIGLRLAVTVSLAAAAA